MYETRCDGLEESGELAAGTRVPCQRLGFIKGVQQAGCAPFGRRFKEGVERLGCEMEGGQSGRVAEEVRRDGVGGLRGELRVFSLHSWVVRVSELPWHEARHAMRFSPARRRLRERASTLVFVGAAAAAAVAAVAIDGFESVAFASYVGSAAMSRGSGAALWRRFSTAWRSDCGEVAAMRAS